MPETRSALPYVSHLRVTKRPTQEWRPNGYQNRERQDLYQQVTDLPGIECEITPYMGSVKGPAKQFRFPSKMFFETALAELQALPVKTEQENAAITNLEATIARTDVIWVESVLMAAGLPTLEGLWADVYSDALDEFQTWKEPESSINGIPLFIKEMQWDAMIPYESAKSIRLKIGVFNNDEGLGVPMLHTLNFEDEQTKKQRLAYNKQIEDRIAQLTTQLESLTGTQKTQAEAEIERFTKELEQRKAVEQGVLLDLVSNPSVQASLPALLLALIGAAYPGIDMAEVQSQLASNLAGVK